MTDRRRTPAEDGLAMPAEWSKHSGCYVAWPCKEEIWYGQVKKAKASYAEVIRTINAFEPVTVLADPSVLTEAREILGADIEILRVRLDDSWARDNGPIFVSSGDNKVALVNFRFNGWGKFRPYDSDDRLPIFIATQLNMRRYDAPMVLEGGSISVDGLGTLLTTEQCLLNPNRNPNLKKEQIEQELHSYLGIKKVLWLARGVVDDLTDGHVDGVACFARAGLVLAAYTNDTSDPNYEPLRENLDRLARFTDSRGKDVEVVRIVQPKAFEHHGVAITPSYCNHYIANGAVIVPTYGIREDKIALETLTGVYPNREIVGVRGESIEIGGGNVHCITQQRPVGEPLGQR